MADPTHKDKSLAAAVDVLKATLAIATGTLVFSAGLLKENIQFTYGAKWLLGTSWCCLGISIIAGSLAQLRVPIMIDEKNPDIRDKWFKTPGQIHHVSFLFGVVCLGAAMTLILSAKVAE
jgi:hypothetical protein